MSKQYKYVISACLCGKGCRYDGGTKLNEKVKALFDEGESLLVCPEQLGGLTVPRTPCEIINGRIVSRDGIDRTEAYLLGSEKVLEICLKNDIKKAILKQNSPSCGSTHIYDGTFTGKKIEGEGVTAKLLRENGIEVSGEESLN